MAKFSKGDKAVVIFCDRDDVDKGISVGDIVTIDESGLTVPFVILKNGRRTPLMDSQMKPYEEPPKEITLNGATYVLKEEQKPDHEWKFGDVAEHDGKRYLILKEYGVSDNLPNCVKSCFLKAVDFETMNVKGIPKERAKFLRRADLSV